MIYEGKMIIKKDIFVNLKITWPDICRTLKGNRNKSPHGSGPSFAASESTCMLFFFSSYNDPLLHNTSICDNFFFIFKARGSY